ncbi:YceI family protein [Nafulsella turpanensis]|uniref:YceI family protein n=1 Tax=Nafulsella turpanensis TaxID=1265690 RepID=UPI000346374B|nr:YceI family protein [Nafulsella turpanensis]
MIKQSALFLSFAMALAACNGGSEGTEAEVGEANEVVEIEEAASLSIEPAQSEVIWRGRKPGGEHYGTIAIEEGTIQLKDDEVVGGTIVMDLTRLEVKDLEGEYKQKLTGHLASPDFFDVENFPKAKFVITAVEPYVAEEVPAEEEVVEEEVTSNFGSYELANPTHTITGNLTMRDTTLSITIPAEIEVEENAVKAKSRFVIDRTDWNLNYQDETDPVNIAKDKFIYNDVNVGFEVVATEE